MGVIDVNVEPSYTLAFQFQSRILPEHAGSTNGRRTGVPDEWCYGP